MTKILYIHFWPYLQNARLFVIFCVVESGFFRSDATTWTSPSSKVQGESPCIELKIHILTHAKSDTQMTI